ncbi:hypothetical protein SLA2020_112450 [Shorea laevis]
MNDSSFNEKGSQGKQQANGDDKIQIYCTNNHEKSKAYSEIVPDSLVAQISQKKERQRRRETDRPLEMSNPAEFNGTWTNNSSRPSKQAKLRMGDNESTNAKEDKHVEYAGPNPSTNEVVKKGTPLEKAQEKERSKTGLTNCHATEQELSFWKCFKSESGEEQEWMGRNQRKPKHKKRKKTKSCLLVYMEERKEE